MWPIPKLHNELVTFSFFPEHLVCSWLHTDQSRAKVHLKAYRRIPLEHLELHNLILYNPTFVKNALISFLSDNAIENAFIAFTLTGPSITEEYIAFPTSTPQRKDFNKDDSRSSTWNYHYVYQNDQGQFVFYVYKVPHMLLLQYKLLAIATRANLTTMTTNTIAHLECYKHIFGSTFRKSQLAVDMMKHNNQTHHLISATTLQQAIETPSHIKMETEAMYLAASYGIFKNQGLTL